MPNSINYFKYFPKIIYNDKSVVNITRRTKILEQLYSSPLSFFSYSVKENERPEDIALYYYDDIGKVWLVFLANNIIDPGTQWPLNDIDFEKMLILKYKIKSNETSETGIINWVKSTVSHYENDEGIRLTKDTYDLNNMLNLIDESEWTAVKIYDHELKLNDQKRNIFLFNKVYASQAEAELKELLSV